MSRVVYIGGFGNGRASMNAVANELQAYYTNVDPFTFSDAVNNPDEITKAVADVDVITHSAGMLAVVGTWPKAIHSFNAPLPTTRTKLVLKTGVKFARMHTPGIGMYSLEDAKAVARYDASCVGELGAHLVTNLRPFANGQIPKFDAIRTGTIAQKNGIPTTLTYMNHDAYYKPTDTQLNDARIGEVSIAHLHGEHDELPLRPSQVLEDYFNYYVQL